MPTANEPITHRESWRIPAWLGLCGRYDAVSHLRTPIAMINTGDALVALNTVKELMTDRGRCFGSSGWTRRSLATVDELWVRLRRGRIPAVAGLVTRLMLV